MKRSLGAGIHALSWQELPLIGFGVVGISASIWMQFMKKLMGSD